MVVSKVSKYFVLPVDKVQKIDQLANAQNVKFSVALETLIDYGLREYERRMGAGEIKA